ncbi:acyl-CoA N-acyltransferase [Phyllosticta citrichinensis]
MNTPGSTDGTNDNSRVNGSPPAVSPHRATIPHPAESPVPAGNRHPVDNPLSAGRPLSAGGPSSTETTNSDNNPQSADSPHRGDTSEAAAQGRIEQLCSEVPFPTPTYAESQKCIIRPYHIRDATALQHHANNRLITRNFSYSFPHPYTYNDARRWILNQPRITTPFTEAETPRPTVHSDGSVDVPWGNTLSFVIASCQQNERNALLSGIGVKPGFNIWNRSAELSFWIAKPYWGRGIATSAVGIFLEALFSRTLGLSRVTACTLRRKTDSGLQANFPARTVLRRNKFKREGCLRKSVFKFGEWWDQEVWAVLREDVMGDEPNMTGAVSSGPVQ